MNSPVDFGFHYVIFTCAIVVIASQTEVFFSRCLVAAYGVPKPYICCINNAVSESYPWFNPNKALTAISKDY